MLDVSNSVARYQNPSLLLKQTRGTETTRLIRDEENGGYVCVCVWGGGGVWRWWKREEGGSRFGLAVRRYAGKQKDLVSIHLRLSSLIKSCDFVPHK